MTNKSVFPVAKRILAIILISFTVFLSYGCQKNRDTAPNNDSKSDHIELDYFNAHRYTATIVENDSYIFWADSNGINRREKGTKNDSLVLKAKKADSLSIYGDYLYFVTDRTVLHRINALSGEAELLFDAKSNEQYLFQINDYCVSGNKIFFDNTLSLFCFDIGSREITELLDTSVYMLQVWEDSVYFLDDSEETFTLYKYSLDDRSVSTVIGNAVTNPSNYICCDFRINNSEIMYSLREPNGTYIIDKTGEQKTISAEIAEFSVLSAENSGIYSFTEENEDNRFCIYIPTVSRKA